MTLSDYAAIFRVRRLFVASGLAFGVVVALAYALVAPPSYSATATLYVSAQTDPGNAQAAYQGSLLSEQRVTSYAQLATSPRVLGEVVQRSQLPVTSEELAGRITATNNVDSVLLDVTATADSPVDAVSLANLDTQVLQGVIAEIERPADPRAISPIAVKVVSPAVPPNRPSSLGLVPLVALGALCGLLVGIAAALARHATDKSIKSRENLRNASSLPVLARLSRTAESTPGMPIELPQQEAEELRTLRTNLQFLDVDEPPRIIGVTSSVAGEGKSTCSARLAWLIAAAGHRVLVVDADLRKPRLGTIFGVEDAAGLTSILAGRASLEDVVQTSRPGLHILTSGPIPPNPSEILGSRSMRDIIDSVRATYDYVIVDTAPLLPVSDTAAMAPSLDGMIILCRYGSTTSTQIREAVERLGAVSARILGAALSLAPVETKAGYGGYGYGPTNSTNFPLPTPSPSARQGSSAHQHSRDDSAATTTQFKEGTLSSHPDGPQPRRGSPSPRPHRGRA